MTDTRIEQPTATAIAAAAACLAAGELVAFPTETVYGLGADATNEDAVKRIFAAKGRPADHPLIVHLGSAAQLMQWARVLPDGARSLVVAFWPGPLTLILPRAAHVSDLVTGGQDSVGLRVPSHPVARALLMAFGEGVAAPSANRFGRISPTTAAHVAADLGNDVGTIIDGGACPVGIESTIVAFTSDEPVLLRPGAISLPAITQVLGYAPRTGDEVNLHSASESTAGNRSAGVPRASGTLASHYAPRTPAQLLPPQALVPELELLAARDERVAVLSRTVGRKSNLADLWIAAPLEPAAYAHDLYANLRALDAADADLILIESPPRGDAWLAVRDRLARATHGEDDDRD